MAEAGESQASENKTSVNLVELFQAGENGIERRRTDNLFKQLDERQLTEDEQAIIQQRVELQRKMFQEYERREKQRKQRELQDLCPDLDESAAVRALELCNWKEEVAAERVSSDPVFLRRVISGFATVEHAPAPKPERHRSNSSRAVVGPRPRLVDPSQVGAVFVGRFKSRLGPHQISAMGRQQHQQPAPAARGSSSQMAGRRACTAATAVGATPKPQAHGELTPVAAAAQSDRAEDDHDEEMADASRVVEPDSGELAAAADGTETETDGEEVHGEGEDHMEEDPNSADLSDNELQYEDDVLPVMSPLVGKRPRTAEQMESEGQQPLQTAEIVGTAAGSPSDEQGASGLDPQQAMSAGQGPDGQQQPVALVAAATRHQGGIRNLAGTHGDDDEVSSPTRGGVTAGTAPTATAAPAIPAVTTCTAADQPMATTTLPTAGPIAIATTAAARPRRVKAELAAVLRHVGDMDTHSDTETGSDGGDSDFELGSTGGRRGGGGGAAADAATSSSESDVGVEDEGSDDFVAPGSRKRRGATGSRRQQQARKRAASGGSGVASRTRQRAGAGGTQRRVAAEAPTAPPGAAALAVATGIAAVAVAAVSVAAAELPDAAGPFSRGCSEVATGSGGEAAASPPGQASLPTGTLAGWQAGPCEDDSEATVTEDESPGGRTKRQAKGKKGKGGGSKKSGGGASGGVVISVPPSGSAAISASGHTCRGRVKQKGVKRADLLAVGSLIAKPGWYNAGYIFPAGFRAQTLFRSSVDLDSLTLHTCEILGENGQYWPAPTFVVTAADRPDEPLVAKSCTGCWTAVLRRINGEIEGRRAAGEDLPPPPKTAIAGPEYFGLNQPEICAAIEALDVERKCSTYWGGKMDREAVRNGGQPAPSRGPSGGGGRGPSVGSAGVAPAGGGAGAASARPPRGASRSAANGGGGCGKGRRNGRRADDDDGDEDGGNEGEDDPEETYAGNRWSAVTRAERYRKRCEEAGEDAAALLEQSLRDNPLPGFLDPITLEPVVNPAISPYGHVMGLATWKAVLAEHGRCPFTKQPLKPEALTVLTKNNIDRYRGRIIQQ
ncbi:hypothetical protein Vretimale_17338 [Volvox reticuliferus]|uniref:U-box domain-containing protein n=1 Tax=Volvox reticuliferus TaxID=1737510 RepID=A0A8J4GT01_9CHLO|nr:hypothetical protein Vretifemale_76 [Volvox reticuliferus]GIM14387.1 hypothetical protein Vretimale_17338 [Volvox reticuliferus]